MDIVLTKDNINNFNYLNFLHDKVIRKIEIKEDLVNFYIRESYYFNDDPKFQLLVNLGERVSDFINVYLYTIRKGSIKGKISDINYIINKNISFEIIDIGYMNSIMFIKGSIIENHKLIRKNILIEFCFENNDSFIGIKGNNEIDEWLYFLQF